MQKITQASDLKLLHENNQFIGSLPEMINSSVTFSGRNNLFFCEKGVKLVNTAINFCDDNAIVYLCENKFEYKLNLSVYNSNVFYSGKNNYFNGVFNAILSESKHLFLGNDCLFSFGIWVRNADPHLIYDVESKKRLNPTKSIFIGDHVWLGQSVMILKGTEIESGSIIGAMSVVSGKKILHNTSWAGNPARKIRENIFWNGSCVHKWTKKDTKKSLHTLDTSFVFKPKKDEYISFEEIDEKLSSEVSSDKKIEWLTFISSDKDKNRFVSVPEKMNDKKSFGLLSKIKHNQ